MKRSCLLFALVCVFAIAMQSYGQPNRYPMPGQREGTVDPNVTKMDPNTVLVSYGDLKLTLAEAEYFVSTPTTEALKAISNQWLDLQLLYADAQKKGLTNDPKAKLQSELMAKQIFAQLAMQKAADVNVTPAQVQEYYEKNKNSDPTLSEPNRFSFTHIKVKTQAEANDLLTKIKAGGDIGELARKFSIAPDATYSGSVKQLPQIGVISQYGDEFAKALESASEGQVIGPIKVQDGFEIARHEGKLSSSVIPFETVKQMIRNVLEQKERSSASQKYLEQLKTDAKDKITKASIIDSK